LLKRSWYGLSAGSTPAPGTPDDFGTQHTWFCKSSFEEVTNIPNYSHMKDTIQTIEHFFAENGLELDKINLKLQPDGQVEHCTGSFTDPRFNQIDDGDMIKGEYDKMKAKDHRFVDTKLDFGRGIFTITRDE
jgi:hypothetical protein